MMPLPAKVFLFIQIARYFGYNYARWIRWIIFFTEYVEEEGRKKGKSASSE